MRTTICDLDRQYEPLLRWGCDALIWADGRYAPCQGCFRCWTAHPAECFMKDELRRICRVVGQADTLTIITENLYGGYSPAVKNVLDRSIGLSTPLSAYRGGQMHHTLRYGRHDLLRVMVYGEITQGERDAFSCLVERNALNYGYENYQIVFLRHPDELEGLL
ncbi:MAG: flavodoxin family protein [Oscillospiraceae bacterium]|nr:flavodoxin family protein [Oscillospiraceae bacterium]